MKKTVLATIMSLTLGAAMLTACGSTAEDTAATEATTVVVEEATTTEAATTEEATTTLGSLFANIKLS